MSLTVPKIDLLPEHLIDQIKAGEVIERPGNLVKEILENAIDAGATKLDLHIKNNGLDLISLKDNGHGMHFDDLPLAFSRHATSKISLFEDLYKLHSFGFRGEALASIAAISRVQCVSNESEIRIEGGQTLLHEKRNASIAGTHLVIQDLFFNTPARLKFIQSQNSEKQFLKRVIFSFILSNPQIEFLVKFDEEDKEIYPIAPDLLTRLKNILPKAQNSILHARRAYEQNELNVYLIPGQFKTPGKWQFVFINNRLILDKQFHRVLTNALTSGLGHDDFQYIACFDLPSESIDVNVHPSKTTIKCLESSKLMGLLTGTIKEMNPVKRSQIPAPSGAPTSFEMIEDSTQRTLQQERHDYNMEGHFSPHLLSKNDSGQLIWIGDEFFLLGRMAYSVKKLLYHFVQKMLLTTGPTIPLMVSEPYPAENIDKARVEELISSGLELELLGPGTLVLRGIPEWMNGFPLRPVVSAMLHNQDFSHLEIHSADWSSSTWETMISYFSKDELIQLKIAADLQILLKEKLK